MLLNLARLKNLLGGKTRSATVTVPAGERFYVIGDVHGRADLLGQLHAMIADDAASRGWTRNQLIYLGDYIDRGPDSRGVMALAMSNDPPGFEKLHLRGNHEGHAAKLSRRPLQRRRMVEYRGECGFA